MLIFQWTSPIREGGLSPIPNEVYMKIFNYLRPLDTKLWIMPSQDEPWIDLVHRRNFSRVALVCRLFYSLMLPWIFESIELASRAHNRGMEQNLSYLNHVPLCRSIIKGCGSAQMIATYIKECSFSGWLLDRNNPSSSWSEFQTLYWKALALMPNVEELRLSDIYINKRLLRSMMKLKCLTSLSLNQCLFSKAKHIRKLSVLRLKSLCYFNSQHPSHTWLVDFSLISSICLDSLLTLTTDCTCFVTFIEEQDCYLPLQELKLYEISNVELLPKVFQKVPALKKLGIYSVVTSQHEIQFDDVLPVLEELCCSSFLFPSLVPGRPISSIRFTVDGNYRKTIDTIQSLFQPSASRIRSLSIPIYAYLKVWKHFPDLESLRLEDQQIMHRHSKEVFKEEILDISHAWSHNSPIQELQIHFAYAWEDPIRDLEFQHEIISTIISPRLPQLHRMVISDCVVWNKTQEDDVWKPSLSTSLLWFAKRLKHNRAKLVDYDGFFERILSTAEEFW